METKTIKQIAEDYYSKKCTESKNVYGRKVIVCGEKDFVLTTKGDSGNIHIAFDEYKEEDKSIKKLFNNLKKKNKLMSEVYNGTRRKK